MTTPNPLPPLDPDLAAMLALSRAFRHLADERASTQHPSALMRDLLPAEMGAQNETKKEKQSNDLRKS